jgi:hypothetical protein
VGPEIPVSRAFYLDNANHSQYQAGVIKGLRRMGRDESYLVHAIRAIIVGHGRCPSLVLLLGEIVDGDAVDLARSLAILLGAIDNGCRRPVTIGYRGDSALTLDEVQILAIIAAAQREDAAELTARLTWLVTAMHQTPVAIAARIIGRILRRHDIALGAARGEPLPAMAVVA